MNELKELEDQMFGHMKSDMIPLSKKRKLLRRLQRKKDRLAQDNPFNIATIQSTSSVDRPSSLWDMRAMPRLIPHTITSRDQEENPMGLHLRNMYTVRDSKTVRNDAVGPHLRTMYTVRDNKIVRLEPLQAEQEEYVAVDIVMPINSAESQLLEGTKMSVDDIRKIDRFKDYEPGIPSKVSLMKYF